MSRLIVVVVLVGLCSCATTGGPPLHEPPPESRSVTLSAHPGRPRVEVSSEDFQRAMARLAAGPGLASRSTEKTRTVPASWEPHQAMGDLVRDYGHWCERRHEAADCLGLFADGRAFLGPEARRTLAFQLALGGVRDELRDALRDTADPAKVMATLCAAVTAYLVLLVIPEPASKVLVSMVTVFLAAYLGADMVIGLAQGWLRLRDEAEEANTFAQLRGAGDRFARVLGANGARVLVMGVAAALGSTANLAINGPSLPGYSRASGFLASDSGGLGLGAMGQVRSAVVVESGVILVLAPAAGVETARAGALAMTARKSGGGAKPPSKKRAAPEKGPGEWRKAKSPATGRAGVYQQQVTGHPPSETYYIGDTEFDGYAEDEGVLIEAKGEGYAEFFEDNLKPKYWCKETGIRGLEEQADRQLTAANGRPVRWQVAERKAADAIRALLRKNFSAIQVVHTPVTP